MPSGLDQTNLPCHHCICRDVPDFADRPAIAGAEILDDIEVLRLQIQVELDANLQLRGVVVTFSVGGPRTGIFGCRGRFWGGCLQRKTFDVLALHGARREGVSHGGQLCSIATVVERFCLRRRWDVSTRL